MRSVELGVFSLVLFGIILGQKHNCEGLSNDDCGTTDPLCEWRGTQCKVKCDGIDVSRECVENDCVYVDYSGCFTRTDVLSLTCDKLKIRSQCLSQKDCYWRVGETGFVGRDSIGECVDTNNCGEAVDKDECAIFRSEPFLKQCFFYNDSCGAAGCDKFLSKEECTKHGVPNLFCSWDNETDICSSTSDNCENSGAFDHATCFVAKQKTSENCFWRYDEGDNGVCKLTPTLTCSELNLEECETLTHEYVGQYCKIEQSVCKSVTPCSSVVGSEIDCISNSSETNQCFYLSSKPPSNSNVKKCIPRNMVTCDKLETITKCYFHGIEGLLCEWGSGGCANKSSCETIFVKDDCVQNSSCFFAVNTDSYFRSDTYQLSQDPAEGSCHTLIGEDDVSKRRNKCKFLVNPTQCDYETHLEGPETAQENVQDCLYSVCAGNVDSNCEGKCVPWSMHRPASDLVVNLEMDTPNDCTGIMDSNQCAGYIRTEATGKKANVPFCRWENQHCYAVEFDETTGNPIIEGNCGRSNVEQSGCEDLTRCTWIDKSCKLQTTSSCESVTVNLDTCDSTSINGHQCRLYETYFEPGYQEVVHYRCKENIGGQCNTITDAKQCNDAGSGVGQTCFWLETLTIDVPGGRCVNPKDPLLTCSNFIASQCPVTDAQLLPFVGAKIVCEVDRGDEEGVRCKDSSFLSIPNYCAQYRYQISLNVPDGNYSSCINTGMCIPVEVVEGVEGVCIPDSANTPTCPLFDQNECHYVDFTEGNTHVGINCEWLSLRGESARCVDASFVQCEDVTDVDNECKAGLREKEEKCFVDEGQCKINRCSSATNQGNCDNAQDGGCEWSDNTCIKKTCERYSSEDCPPHCYGVGGCSTYGDCGSVENSDRCPKALPGSGKRCYWSDDNGCVDVTSTSCDKSTIKNECENMKPNDGYGCVYKESDSESKCVLAETVSCQGILPANPEQCHPGNVSTATPSTQRLFAHFSEWCDYNGNTDPKSCQPKCAAIENDEDCLRESTNCDLFVGHKCRSRFFTNGESDNCASAGFLECKYQCRWVDNATGCEAIPEPPDADNTSMTRAVIIGSVIGGVVIILLIVGIIVVILLYMRMKKKHAEEEERLRREAEEAENDEDGGSGGESKNVNMDANPDAAANSGGDGGW